MPEQEAHGQPVIRRMSESIDQRRSPGLIGSLRSRLAADGPVA